MGRLHIVAGCAPTGVLAISRELPRPEPEFAAGPVGAPSPDTTRELPRTEPVKNSREQPRAVPAKYSWELPRAEPVGLHTVGIPYENASDTSDTSAVCGQVYGADVVTEPGALDIGAA